MPMWDVKVALVIMRVWEPQAALEIMVTQDARIVQAVLVRGLVVILVTVVTSLPIRWEGPLDHPPALARYLVVEQLGPLVMSRVLVRKHV